MNSKYNNYKTGVKHAKQYYYSVQKLVIKA